jgi:DNA-binding beta-propeller fold protein YncE
VALSDEQRLADGAQVVPAHPQPDRLTLVAFGPGVLRQLDTIAVPTSVIGPPGSVAITPDGRFSLVTDARRIDPADPTRIVPSGTVSLISLVLGLRPIAAIEVGAGASGVAIDPTGRFALVASRSADSVSLLSLANGGLHLVATLNLPAGSSPAQPIFIDGGRRALVTRDHDHLVSVLAIAPTGLRLLPDPVVAGLRPYALTSAGGRYAETWTA